MDPPTPERADDIAAFLQGQHPGTPHPAKDHITVWKICDNEAKPGFASVMVVDPGERIVSVCTVTPKRLWRNGKDRLWGEIGDTFTDEPYLRKGMFAAVVTGSRSRAQAAGVGIVYGLPNGQSLAGYLKKLDFAVKHDLVFDGFTAVLSTQSLGVRRAKSPALKGVLSHPWVARGTRRLAQAAWTVAGPRRRGVTVASETTFGPEFDALWERAKTSLPNAQVRDARYLDWRYMRSPFPFVVLAARKDGNLLGYAATLTIRHGEEGPFCHTILLDWLFDPTREDAAQALLAGVLRHAFSERADVLSAVVSTSSPLQLPFSRSGFLRRPRPMPVIVHRSEEGQAFLADPSPWHFTLSDTDAF
jgi:hypothetical protein